MLLGWDGELVSTIRLGAWKRTTNGYGLLFHHESNLLVVVNRTDTLP